MDISKFGKFPDLHCHCGEGSLRDTGSTVAELVAREKALGATAMAITDHGTMTAIQNFRVACEKNGIKPIYGCEFYTDIGDGARTHFVLLAKNWDGYQAISKINTDTAYNIHDDRPIATFDMFRKWITEGIGKDNVIATSACIQGPIARVLLKNTEYDEAIKKISKKRDAETNPEADFVADINHNIDLLQLEVDKAKAVKDEIFALAKKTWKKEYNKAMKSENPDEIAAVEQLKAEIEAAIAEKPKAKADETKANAKLREYKESVSSTFKSIDKYNKYTEQIKEFESQKISEEELFVRAEEMLTTLLEIFGKDNFYIELQNHGLDKESYTMPIQAKLARKHGISMVCTNDVHYATKDKAIVRHYNFVQYKKGFYRTPEASDDEMYIKTSEEIADCLCKILPEDVVEEAIANAFKIADMCNVTFEIGKHYPKFPCKEGATIHLRRLINRGKSKIKNWTPEYQKRVEYELRVIESMGFSDYLCIVEDFINYGKLVGKCNLNSPEFLEHRFDLDYLKQLTKDEVGEGIGPGRGSAAGSLICYLIGITNIDPLKDELLFERFLNPERVTMPDIDTDVAPNVRPFVIDYIKNKYGEKSVCQIMTISYFGAKSAIQAAGRYMDKREGVEKKYLPLSMELSKSIDEAKASIDDIEEDLLAINNSDDAKEMISIAKTLVGLPSGYGTHAAGIIISDNGDVSDYTPLMNVSGAIDCQLDLNWVEPMGMLKLDLLGLRNLGIITECEKVVLKENGIRISVDSMPVEPEIFSEIFSKGNTNGVFQFESLGMKKTLMNFGPESISDLTLLNAIFRPGPLQYIDYVTDVKKGRKEAEYIIPEMSTVLDATYGKPIYQEQIQQIFNKFAGFSLGKADIIRRHMAKKHFEEFAEYKDQFVDGMVERGAKSEDVENFWEELLNFAAYAFNKSHARAYCEVAYATAYLKYHYPEAYACGLLNYTNAENMSKIVLDTKNQGINIKCPDINLSSEIFSVHGSDVLFGLKAIPNVAAKAQIIIDERNRNGKFSSFKNFLTRVNGVDKRAIENLIKAGAFDAFQRRATLLAALPELLDILKKWRKKEADMSKETDAVKKDKMIKSIKTLKDSFYAVRYENISYNKTDVLNAEKALLGEYVSAHPMDGIKTQFTIEAVGLGKTKYAVALVSDINVKYTKTGREMANMKLSDGKTIIEAVMFPNDFDKYGSELRENSILKFYGSVDEERGDDGEITRSQFKVSKIYEFKKYDGDGFVIDVPEGTDIEKSIEQRLSPYKDDTNGINISIRTPDKPKVCKVDFKVDKSIKADLKKIKWIMK